MYLLFGLAELACLVALVRPYKPFTKRWQGGLAFILLAMLSAASVSHEVAKPTATTIIQPPQAASPTPTNLSEWNYSEEKDEMRDKSLKTACVTSHEMLHFSFPYGEESATLCIRNSPAYGKGAYINISRGQFLCHFSGCSILVKFGNAKPERFSASGPSDNSTTVLFIRNYPKFAQGLKKSDQVIIEAEFYHEGSPQIKFNTKNFDATKIESK